MAEIKMTRSGDMLGMEIVGVVNEDTKFPADVSAKKVVIDSSGVRRLNSVGIKSWISFFEALVREGASLEFVACSVPVVQQFNSLINFGAGGKVKSLYLPFFCDSCESSFQEIRKAEAISKEDIDGTPKAKCTSCGEEAEFDDDPGEYFFFLRRANG